MDLKFIYHNYSYWIKQVLGIIIISTVLIKNDFKLIQNIWNLSSIILIILLFVGLIGGYKSYWIYFKLNKKEQRTLESIFLNLARSMGCYISTYFPAKDYSGVFVCCGTELVIGENAKDILSKQELEAVLAHEFSHNTRKTFHNRLGYVRTGFYFLILVVFIFIWHFSYKIVLITLLTCFYVIESRFSWEIECDCDKNAVKYVPIDDFASALSKIYKGELDIYSFKHPSPNYLIKRLIARAEGHAMIN